MSVSILVRNTECCSPSSYFWCAYWCCEADVEEPLKLIRRNMCCGAQSARASTSAWTERFAFSSDSRSVLCLLDVFGKFRAVFPQKAVCQGQMWCEGLGAWSTRCFFGQLDAVSFPLLAAVFSQASCSHEAERLLSLSEVL